jgi:hypothetical protein
MKAVTYQQTERATQRTQANRQELVEQIMTAVPQDSVIEPLPGLHLARAAPPDDNRH